MLVIHDSQKYVKVSIDSKNYQFFREDDSVSMADDTVIIKALKAGKMTVVGYSKRGREEDVYTLIGFTNAYNSLKRLLRK